MPYALQAVFFRCFRTHRTLLPSGCWQFTSRPSAKQGSHFSMAGLAVLVWTLFFRMALLPPGKRDFFGALIGLSRLLGWLKRAYVLFPEYIQEKTHTPFLANQATWKGKSALQRSLASQGAKGPCGKKASKPEMQDRPWRNGSLATLMGGM